MDKKDKIDSSFLTAVSLLAHKYNCKIVDIDLENRIIELDCPPENELDCAIELERIFHQYTM